jgi:Family of unknown function (DUF6311)
MQVKHSRANHFLTQVMALQSGQLPAFAAYPIAIVIACGFVAYMFPLSFLMGHSTVFDYGDIAQHVSGWWYYARDSWHFPLLHTTRLDHPTGVSIAYTDSIPLLALPFKVLITLFPNLLPAHFHYFGWWMGLVFISQAVAATFLVRALGAKSLFAVLISVGFALTWPIIHARYHHPALMMQSMIIYALALYFLGRHKIWSSSSICTAFVGLNLVALTVHPYFLPFTSGIFAAFLADQAIKGESWLRQLKRLLILCILLICVILLLGYTGRAPSASYGYGTNFYLDLISPFCGGGKLIACGDGPVYAFPYHEGFNYLGAGLILLIPFAAILNWRAIVSFPITYPAFTLLLLGFLLYTLTNQVHFNDAVVFSFDLPVWLEGLTGTFRAAGRFFWPISTFIMFVTLASLLKKINLRFTYTLPLLLLLTTALILQVKDVKPWLSRIQTEAAKPSQLNFADWAPVMERIDKVVSYPIHECPPLHYLHNIWVMQLAGYYEKLLNSGYTARGSKSCTDDDIAIKQPFQERHLYIMSNGPYANNPFTTEFTFPVPFQQAMNKGECVRRLIEMVCLPGSSPEFWQKLTLETSPIKLIPGGRQWGAAELNTHIGQVVNLGNERRLIPIDSIKAGWLSFGLGISLPVGTYRFEIDFASKSSPNVHVGNWDVVLDNDKKLGNGKLMGSQGKSSRITGVFTIEPQDVGKSFELRTFFLAQGDLQVMSSSVRKIP